MATETTSNSSEIVVPECLGLRAGDLKPVLEKWAKEHPGAPWSYLLRKALKRELKDVAGKRYAHLVQ